MSGLLQVVAAHCGTDLARQDVPGLQSDAEQLRQALGQLTGRLDQVLAEIDQRGEGMVRANPHSDGPALFTATHVWWRDQATVSGGQAGRDLRRARTLRELPLIGQAVVDGRLAPEQAAALCRLSGAIPHEDLLASQEQLVLVAAAMNPEELARWVRHQIATHCEPQLDGEHDRAEQRRYLQVTRHPDGSISGRFRISAEAGEPVLTVLEPLARRQGLSDQRSAGQRRADALVEVFSGALQWMDLPQAGGQRPQLSYVMPAGWACGDPAPTLQELLEAGLLTLTGPRGAADPQPVHPQALEEHCATAAWTGPQTRAQIETILCDARINRVLRDSIGQVIGLDSLRDEVTTAQRRALVARDRHCVAKGCTRPPAFCDAHHLVSREDGGPTTLDNLVLLCRRHHLLWHRGELKVTALHLPWLYHPVPGHNAPLVA